jgi:hypothetical protein
VARFTGTFTKADDVGSASLRLVQQGELKMLWAGRGKVKHEEMMRRTRSKVPI